MICVADLAIERGLTTAEDAAEVIDPDKMSGSRYD
jgi:hypothetical protein